MVTNMFCGKKVFLDFKIPISCTGEIVDVKGRKYLEFVQGLPAPDWFRIHYFSEEGLTVNKENQITSQDHFTELKYRPQILQRQIESLMRKQLNAMSKTG